MTIFEEPKIDLWRQAENWYGDVDLQAGDDLEDQTLEPRPAAGR